jgi:hypothetical protein
MATETPCSRTIECGEEAAKHFAFDAGYINLNHGQLNQHVVSDRD